MAAMICRCGECKDKGRRLCPFACPWCYRDLIDGSCHHAADHPTGRPFYSRWWAAQCGGKMKFPSKAYAKRYLARSLRFKGRDRVRPYLCPWCGCWHLGGKKHQPLDPPQPTKTRYTISNEQGPLGGGEGEDRT